MENADWAFCAVAFESPSLADSEDTRTYPFDGQRLRTLAEIAGRDMHLYKVAGADHGFLPVGPPGFSPSDRCKPRPRSLSSKRRRWGPTRPLWGLNRRDHIYGDAKGNKCFHADPYFGSIKPGEERKVSGKLYLMKGNAQEALKRYQHDFAG